MPSALTRSPMASSTSGEALRSDLSGVSRSMVYIITLRGLMSAKAFSQGATYASDVLSTEPVRNIVCFHAFDNLAYVVVTSGAVHGFDEIFINGVQFHYVVVHQ